MILVRSLSLASINHASFQVFEKFNMNVCTPNISWHGCDPVYSCAINPIDTKRLATAGMRGKWFVNINILFHLLFIRFYLSLGY